MHNLSHWPIEDLHLSMLGQLKDGTCPLSAFSGSIVAAITSSPDVVDNIQWQILEQQSALNILQLPVLFPQYLFWVVKLVILVCDEKIVPNLIRSHWNVKRKNEGPFKKDVLQKGEGWRRATKTDRGWRGLNFCVVCPHTYKIWRKSIIKLCFFQSCFKGEL